MSEIKLPEVELNIYSPKDPVEVEVVENYIVTKESSPNIVRHITFNIAGTDLENRVGWGSLLVFCHREKMRRGVHINCDSIPFHPPQMESMESLT